MLYKFTDVSEEYTAFLFWSEEQAKQVTTRRNRKAALEKMKAVRSSEASANFYRTIQRHIPEDSTLR
jgi:hypothetical protein